MVSVLQSLVVIYIAFNMVSHVDSECPLGCKNITVSRIKCVGKIPFSVPDNVVEVELSQIDSREFYAGRFCHHVSWSSVKLLIFDSVNVIGSSSFGLDDDVFKCLGQIKTFKFSSKFLNNFSRLTFSGLKNVTVLDLSDCTHIPWTSLKHLLTISKNIPKLSRLILSRTGLKRNCLIIDSDFLKALSIKPLTYLDLSYTCFKLKFSKPGKLCKTLSTFKYAGATVVHSDEFVNCTACGSLRVVDDSDDNNFRQVFHNNPCINSAWAFNPKSPFFENVRVLYQNFTITPSDKFTMHNCSWRLFDRTKTVEYYFTNNYLPNFDVRLKSDRLKLIDLSHNTIQNINHEAFKMMTSLEILNLSYNNLSKGETFHKTFSALFEKCVPLKIIDISFNQFANIPRDTFISNLQLEELRLAGNAFQQLHFSISHLLNLKIIDMRFNSIRHLDGISRHSLDMLFNMQNHRHTKTVNGSSTDVMLEGNPFSCECLSLEFLEWFVSSPIFASSRHKYQCEINGQIIQMTIEAVVASKEDCKRIERKRLAILLSTTLSVVSISVVITTVVILYKRRKRSLVQQHLKDSISRLKDHPNRFPVLLSYSSQDSDFVKEHILQQLQRHLQAVTKLNRHFVCNADDHFIPGHPILKEIFRCISSSEVFVAVVSKNYCSSRFCHYEIEHAYFLKKPIILIFIEHVDVDVMNLVTKEIFETFSRVKFVTENGEYKIHPDWPEICQSIIQMM